jgi:signal transduction histidine kinase
MVSSGEPLIVTDLWPDNGFWPQEAEGEKVHSLMGIPIQVEGKVFGVFLVSSDRPCAFTEPDQQLLMTLANLAATAIRRARLYETLQQHSAELERANVELRESREQCEVSYRQLLATQAQLIQAEKMSTLGHLAAGIAHEIKTPLTGIQGAVEVLREDFAEQQDPRGAILEDVVRQISRLDQSVADFLRFARPARLQLQWTSVNDVVDSVCSLLQTQAGRYHAHLLKEYTDDAIAGWLDPDQIRQVLLNIGVNALEALGDAGGQVVFTTARHPDGANLVITVSDTGNGMPPDVLAQAFAPYFTTKSTGTGLGLAIAQRIMVEHGGTIAVESEVEQGTRFTLTLPVTRDGLTGEA